MKEKKQNEELQSRREFFKQAAKKALPVIGAIALASTPIIAQAAERNPMGCSSDGCSYTCQTSCARECRGRCNQVCKDSCYNDCRGTCKDSCSGSCKGSCSGYSK